MATVFHDRTTSTPLGEGEQRNWAAKHDSHDDDAWNNHLMQVTVLDPRTGDPRVRVLGVMGEIDVHTAPRLRDSIASVLDGGDRDLVIDLQNVRFLDSTGLGVLVGALKRARNGGGSLALVCSRERVLKVFALTGLDRVFRIVPSFDAL